MTEDPKITTDEEFKIALSSISMDHRSPLNFKWRFQFRFVEMVNPVRRGWLLWAEFERTDVITGEKGLGRGRDELIWCGATLSAVVKTAWVIVEMMVRHELMHAFLFDGKPLFDPHATVERLNSISGLGGGNTYSLANAAQKGG